MMMMPKRITGPLLLAIAFAVVACRGGDDAGTDPAVDEAAPAMPAEPARDLEALLASDNRSEADRGRDAGRRPAKVLEFLGIGEGMRVIDVIAAGGWYTEVLSIAVGDEGQVVAQNPPSILQFRDGRHEKAISARLADNRLPNVVRLNKDFPDLAATDGPFDAAITALNFHDIYNRRGQEAAAGMLQAVAGVLKPGAVFGIIDHVGEAGADNAALHRIEISRVLETIEAAGLIVDSDSDLLRNEADDHSLPIFDEAVRGQTDRFLLKVRTPGDRNGL
jgi:predicted methyltransferase